MINDITMRYETGLDKLEKEYFDKINEFLKTFSLKEVCIMVIEDYNGRNNCVFRNFIYNNDCEIVCHFYDIYSKDEIYNYIISHYDVKGKTITKTLINESDIQHILEKYYQYSNDCNTIYAENGKFYKVLEKQTDIEL